MDILQSIDPNIAAIVLGLIILSFLVMMLIYIPRIDKLRKLENEKKQYKSERDYAVEQWSIAMISSNRQKDKILNDLKNTEGRKNQYSKIAKTMAEAYDKVKKDQYIDIPKPELPVVTFNVSRDLPIKFVMDYDSEKVRSTLNQDLAELIGRYIIDHELAKIIFRQERVRDTFNFDAEVKVIDPRATRFYDGLNAFLGEKDGK